MSFTDVAPPETHTARTGISFSLWISKTASAARLSFTAAAQMEIFERSIIAERCFAKAGRGPDEGRLLLVMQADGDLEFRATMRGGASIRMNVWDPLPKDKRPAGAVDLIGTGHGGLLDSGTPWRPASRSLSRAWRQDGRRTRSEAAGAGPVSGTLRINRWDIRATPDAGMATLSPGHTTIQLDRRDIYRLVLDRANRHDTGIITVPPAAVLTAALWLLDRVPGGVT